MQNLRLTWPQLQYSAALLDALDSALSIYPAERPQSVAEMRARLDAAAPVASRYIIAAEHPSPVLENEAASESAATHSEPPLYVEQDLHFIAASEADSDTVEPSVYANLDDDAPMRAAVARQRKPRRIAIWSGSGALVALLALGIIAIQEFGQQHQLARALQALGIGRGTLDNAAVAASAEPPVASGAGVVRATGRTRRQAGGGEEGVLRLTARGVPGLTWP